MAARSPAVVEMVFVELMPEHYTKNTLECTVWCNKCGRSTQHRVDGGRRGPCLEHDAPELSQAQRKNREKRERERQQPGLFGEKP